MDRGREGGGASHEHVERREKGQQGDIFIVVLFCFELEVSEEYSISPSISWLLVDWF